MDFLNLLEKYGLGTALAVGVFFIFFYLLKWTLKHQDMILVQAAQEREKWQLLFERNNKAIDEHILQSRLAHEATSEAHKAQRVEHVELTKQMLEVTAALGRINGYKEH